MVIYHAEKLFQAYCGGFEVLYYPIYRLLRGINEQVVSDKTDIVIEGFPRSGNTFAVTMLKHSQNAQLSIASHLHVSSQILRAKRLGKPAVVLVRDPISAVSSFVIRDGINVGIALDYYRRLYKPILKILDYPLVVDFDTLTGDFSDVIRSVNLKFQTRFVLPTDLSRLKSDSLRGIDEHYRFIIGKNNVSLTSSSPNTAREFRKKDVENHIASFHFDKLKAANDVYNMMRGV